MCHLYNAGYIQAEIEYIIDNEDLESRNDVTDYQSYVKGAEQMRFQLRKAIKNYINTERMNKHK